MSKKDVTVPLNHVPHVDEFALSDQQRTFHDAFTDGPTRGNAYQSAVSAGYTEQTAHKVSSTWTPKMGETPETVRTKRPIVQAIYWTLHRRSIETREAEARSAEARIQKKVVTKEYVTDSLIEIAERCMGHDVLDARGRDLAARLGDELKAELGLTAEQANKIGVKFRLYAKQHSIFRPAEARLSLRLLGVDIGMFVARIQKIPETAVDLLDVDELQQERDRMAKEWEELKSSLKAKGVTMQ